MEPNRLQYHLIPTSSSSSSSSTETRRPTAPITAFVKEKRDRVIPRFNIYGTEFAPPVEKKLDITEFDILPPEDISLLVSNFVSSFDNLVDQQIIDSLKEDVSDYTNECTRDARNKGHNYVCIFFEIKIHKLCEVLEYEDEYNDMIEIEQVDVTGESMDKGINTAAADIYDEGDDEIDDEHVMRESLYEARRGWTSMIEKMNSKRYNQICGWHDSCTVCMQEFFEAKLVAELPCSHIFHAPCVVPWLKERNSCPLCRFSQVNADD